MYRIKHMVHNWRMRKQQLEFDRWYETLNAMNGDELGAVIVIATSARHLLEKEYGVELLDPAVARTRCVDLVVGLDGCINALRAKGNEPLATGAMVWLHTLRCVGSAEMRSRGRLLWQTLQRGMPHAENAVRILSEIGIEELDITDFDQIPVGLGPLGQGKVANDHLRESRAVPQAGK